MSFGDLFREFDLAALDAADDVVYGLDERLRLVYRNPAWFRFASENGGEPALAARFGTGTCVLDAIGGPLRDFYRDAYARALATGQVWAHDYECSSAETRRVYRQTVYPLRSRDGLLVVNSLTVSEPMKAARKGRRLPLQSRYRDGNGLITQCSHCRRVQLRDNPNRWDWVPAWVKEMPEETSHGLCPACYGHYYTPLGRG